MLETVRSAVRRLSKISNSAFECDYYYYYYGLHLEIATPGIQPGFARGASFPIESYQNFKKVVLLWLPCHASDVTGSVLGLAGPMSVYRCDWVG